MRAPARLGLLALAALTAGCQLFGSDGPPAEQAAAEPAKQEAQAEQGAAEADQMASLPAPRPGAGPAAGQVPHIYMALQDGGEGRPASVVFAIDASRDGTPSNDAALRLTPEKGLCNPQEMNHYDFPPDAAPAVGDAEAAAGLTPQDLPAYMAVAVTNALLQEHLATTPEDTRPLNICTRKLWQQLVQPEPTAAAGQ